MKVRSLSINSPFSVEEPDGIRTYIWDKDEDYVIVLEPLRNKDEYYLLTAITLRGKIRPGTRWARNGNDD